MPLHRMMSGAFSFSVFCTCLRGYVRTNVHPSVRMWVHTYIHDPVRLRLRHLYQVKFCSFIVRYPTTGAFVYCGHIPSLFGLYIAFNNLSVILGWCLDVAGSSVHPSF